MLEPKSKAVSKTEALQTRKVTIYLEPHLILLSGNWQWDLQTDELFCSNIFMALSPEQSVCGTKCLLHPDDVLKVSDAVDKIKRGETVNFNFRVITTYGEIKGIRGVGRFSVEEKDQTIATLLQKQTIQYGEEKQLKEQHANAMLQLKAYQYAEQVSNSGVWYINTVTHEAFYSDNIYCIYGLMPQSVNAHYHTFTGFIHPDDKETVTSFFDQAYNAQVPLHLEYRIITCDGVEKNISQLTKWLFNAKGELILTGIVEDRVRQKSDEQSLLQLRDELNLKEQMLQQAEQASRHCNWYINLYTRKTVYSDTIFSICGIKAHSLTINAKTLTSLTYPEDQPLVQEAFRKMIYEHTAPEIDFRIVRPDGKIRYLRQKGKVMINTAKEMIITGTILDMTDAVVTENKLRAAESHLAIRSIAGTQEEEIAGTGYWLNDMNSGEIEWSEGLYQLLGLRPQAVQLTQKIFLNFIIPGDKKDFEAQLQEAMKGGEEIYYPFRMIRKGETQHFAAHFKTITANGRQLLLTVIHHITKEHQAAQQLAEQLMMTETVSNALQDIIFVTDNNNYIINWNKHSEAAYGIKKEKVIGQHLFDIIPSLKTSSLLQAYQQALKGESLRLENEKSVFTSGYYHVSLTPVKDGNDEVTGVLTIIHDVTEEQELRLQLTDRLQFIEKLLEATIDRIVVLDKNMNYQYWNQRAEEYYDINKEKVLGKNILEVFPGFVNDPSYQEFKQALKGNLVHIPARENLENKKGYFETYLIPVKSEGGEVTSVLWLVHNLINEYRLVHEQKRSDRILDTINEVYLELDYEYNFTYINQKTEEVWGKSRKELLGKNIWDLFPGSENSGGYHIITQAMTERTEVQGEYFSELFNKWTRMSATPSAEGIIVLMQDIGEVKITQQKLKESNELLQSVFDVSLVGIAVFKSVRSGTGEVMDFEYQLANRVTEEIAGSTLAGRRYLELYPHVKTSGIFDQFKSVIETGRPLDFEHYYDGEYFHNWYRITAIKLNDGLVSTVEDITQRKQAERSLNESRHFIQRITETTPDILFVMDLNTREILYTNRPIAEVLGYNQEQINGMKNPFFDMMYEPDIPRIIAHIDAMKNAADGEVLESEYRMKSSKGNLHWFKDRCVVFERNEAGVPITKVGMAQDMTEQRQQQEEIEKNLNILQQAEHITGIGSWEYDVATRNFKWSEGMYRLLKVSQGTIVSPQIYEQVAVPEDLQLAKQIVAKLQKDYEPFDEVLRIEVDGEHKILKIKSIVLKDGEGRPAKVLGIDLDITEITVAGDALKAANLSLQQKAHELEDKNEELTQFAFVASHDLREPLRKIHTFNNWLIEKEQDRLSDSGKDYFNRMNGAVKRMGRLIDDILTLSRIHSSETVMEAVDLNEVLKKAMAELSEPIKSSAAHIEQPSLPLVKGNEQHLLYLFKNLLSNAIKFQPSGQQPQIKITAEELSRTNVQQAGLALDKAWLKISVSDNGIGFDQRYEKKIFYLFQRLHGLTEYDGTGMGLTICKKVMENHHGLITAESVLGKGSVFSCYFPI